MGSGSSNGVEVDWENEKARMKCEKEKGHNGRIVQYDISSDRRRANMSDINHATQMMIVIMSKSNIEERREKKKQK